MDWDSHRYQVRFVDALVRTGVGKLNKRAMREQFSQ